MKKGTLVLSLDFELVWGIFDHIRLEEKVRYFDQTLQVIPQILACFEKNDIQATWATVGMLFNDNWDEWMANRPEHRPAYVQHNLDAYQYGERHRNSGYDRFFFAPHLIQAILATRGQELATHTYSHYYCLESGQTVEHFKADLTQVVVLAKKFGATMESLVFPRNQFQESYLDVCLEAGIQRVRTNPKAWYWTNPMAGLASKVVRTADAYLPFAVKSYASTTVIQKGIQGQPSCRFFQPHHSANALNSLRLRRIIGEMRHAAMRGEIYHLWWHPHNFGNHPEESMTALKTIVAAFKELESTYGFQSLSMNKLPFDY